MRTATFLATAIAATAVRACWPEAEGKEIKYSTVTGYFLQDEPSTDPNSFDYAQWNFGLLNRTYPTDHRFDPDGTRLQWERFAYWVNYLNRKCSGDDSVRYKMFVMGRHGEGWHNAAESYYGTPAWNCYWSVLDGNGTAVWADPLLTPAGFDQAYKANAYFASRFTEHGMPYFDSYYSSPLSRCTVTANLTFADLALPATQPFTPVIKENLREGISIHTCDRRSSKSYIHELVPSFDFEAGFTEEDELWRGDEDLGETHEAQVARTKEVLDDMFVEDGGTWVSITSHSGEIRTLLEVMGHRAFRLSTGQIIPVLVKAEVVEPGPTETFDAWEADPTCDSPPVTSIGGEGCVCSTGTTVLPRATGL